ncbi:enterochelin esterase [Pseudomonas sp. RIT-PI-S]|uniref:enterochelin esterase n=1 Tax=Pseudomonas sp. RIT-PI-S TaxID=3035295 RepID=UPI0021D9A875|nr:enterochelin esterase [Pseudomonas sp. RIT-PI-S]
MQNPMLQANIGTEPWWQAIARQGTPLIEPAGHDSCRLTFLWRDPEGSAEHSSTRRVWINITGVTDHHQATGPQSLERLAGTDVWQFQVILQATWRGSYSLIPSTDEHTPAEGREALRAWWASRFSLARQDPLNLHRGWVGQRGVQVSTAQLPEAPAQPAWAPFDQRQPWPAPGFAELHGLEWDSPRLGNRRRVWVGGTGARDAARRPLAILLDGRFWAETVPVGPALTQLTAAGALPEALYVLIDNIDSAHRGRELTCNPDFWLAVQEELLPLVRDLAEFSEAAATTVVAGQSFGGLSALYAGLHWPQRFGCVLSQSGSYWWPRRAASAEADAGGWLVEQIEQGLGEGTALKLYLEAGSREPLIDRAHQRLVQVLTKHGWPHAYRRFNGGHDALCWRGGLLDGLAALWADLPR